MRDEDARGPRWAAARGGATEDVGAAARAIRHSRRAEAGSSRGWVLVNRLEGSDSALAVGSVGSAWSVDQPLLCLEAVIIATHTHHE
jgi:hypothetical protein